MIIKTNGGVLLLVALFISMAKGLVTSNGIYLDYAHSIGFVWGVLYMASFLFWDKKYKLVIK